MANIGVLKTSDGVIFEVVDGEPFPCEMKDVPRRTIYLAPDPCSGCGSRSPRTCDVFFAEQSALFVSQQGMTLPEAIVAFRSRVDRPGFPHIDRRLIGGSFSLDGAYRLVVGRLTADMLQAMILLYLPQSRFEKGEYPAPYVGDWKNCVVRFSESVVRPLIEPYYGNPVGASEAEARLRLHQALSTLILFIPNSAPVSYRE